jgi:subtilisin-like proprotein convertase family protein
VDAFVAGTLPNGPGVFHFLNQAVPGLSGSALGSWQLCISDNGPTSDTGVLTSWSVHD